MKNENEEELDIALLHEEEFKPQEPHVKKYRYIKWIPRVYWLFYRKPLNFIIIITSCLPGVTSTLNTYFMGKVIDALSADDPLAEIKKYSILLFLINVVSAAFSYINSRLWVVISSKIGIKIRSMLFKSLMNNDITFYDQNEIGRMLNLLGKDATTVESIFNHSKSFQARLVGQFFTAITTSLSINIPLTLITLSVLLAGQVLIHLFKKLSRKYSNKASQLIGNSITIADESVANARVVASFNRQDKELERYKEVLDEFCKYEGKTKINQGISFSISYLINWVTVSFVLSLGCVKVAKGELTAGALFTLSRSSFMGSLAIRNFLQTIAPEQRAIDASERIFEVVDMQPTTPTSGGITLPTFKGNIEFKNVWFKYPTRDPWVLQNVSFKVNAGEIAAFVGHSGSGKSTIVQLILRFYDVNEGVILFDDVPITDLDPHWIHKVIGVVQQDPVLFAKNVIDNIKYSVPDATFEEVENAAHVAHADGFIDELPQKYETFIGEKGSTLSGGQKQRIAIARAVLKNPPIFIADEATSALDAESEKEVQEGLDAVMEGRTSLIIAHRLGTIRSAKTIYVFDKGEIVESGAHDELVAKKGHFYNLVQRQLTTKSDQ
ncbi:ABC transporter family protein [Histomonas meleagridis]|uniref:ABC transporter family protein n=1 Tax=Histomonas meleagridis TaxID=135588 RepID=UPI00355AC27D|nr:ABC transporter family protein [Histomonas meleagridis]KAH0806722.1 ABC transporter family protein [Histomonas meleagridis]